MSGSSSENSKLGIKSWSEEDRPREKLQLKGRDTLTDAELIGILLGSGTINLSAVDVGKLLLKSVDGNLNQLSKLTVKELCKIPGIGPAKAVTLIAALELGRRRKAVERPNKKIASSKDAFEHIYPYLADLDHERFFVILLNRANVPIKVEEISRGGISGTLVDPKLVFSKSLEVATACSLILCHNHPSGNLNPSKQDNSITKKLVEGGKLLDFQVLDHIIVAGQQYYSYADEGIMPS
ncbi:MAG: DNA repair protein RadC [Bacteroidetes bacterium]|nr:DNA repair protein RadC [Bacteroidota bacterium]